MASKDQMPVWFQKYTKVLPEDGQAKLIELQNQYKFSEDQVECFNVNSGSISMANLEEFRKFVEQESSKEAKPTKAAGRGYQPTPARAPLGAISSLFGSNKRALPSAIAAQIASSQASTSQNKGDRSPDRSSTPNPKRLREADEGDLVPARGTPDPPSKVSVKSSVNENLAKPEPGANAAAATQIQLLGDSSLWKGAYRWMDEAIEDRAAAQDAQLTAMEGEILAATRARPAARLSLAEGDEEVAAGTVGLASQAEVVLCGRLVCEGLEGRLNERSILLEGSQASCKGARVNLNLSNCPHVAAFPGQVVGVLGRSGNAGMFHARDFVAGLPPPMPSLRAAAQLHLMVAAGPFCLRDRLDFSPLEQVLAHAVRMRPRVLLLMGPLLDASNLKVSSGETVLPGEDEPRPYEEVYTQYLLPLLARGLAPLRQAKPATEVLLMPSLDEVLCFHPLPQPPLDVSLTVEARSFSALHSLGVKFLPNPAHLEINGLRVSASSADALSPVLRELVLRPAERKIEEALRLLLGQRTLFPVVPRDPAQVSESRASALSFPDGTMPHLCVFPSAAGGANGTFVDGTAFVNPGVLCRGTLGTFAEVMVLPDRAAQGGNPLKLSERARVDILKLDS